MVLHNYHQFWHNQYLQFHLWGFVFNWLHWFWILIAISFASKRGPFILFRSSRTTLSYSYCPQHLLKYSLFIRISSSIYWNLHKMLLHCHNFKCMIGSWLKSAFARLQSCLFSDGFWWIFLKYWFVARTKPCLRFLARKMEKLTWQG